MFVGLLCGMARASWRAGSGPGDVDGRRWFFRIVRCLVIVVVPSPRVAKISKEELHMSAGRHDSRYNLH